MPFFRPLDTDRQQAFYDDLVGGKVTRSILSAQKRFSEDRSRSSRSFEKYFVPQVSAVLDEDMSVVDVGCGNGLLFPMLAPLCREVTGIELTPAFVEQAEKLVAEVGLDNVSVWRGDATDTAFDTDRFDAAVIMDTLHHIYDMDGALDEVARIVRPGGDVIIIEPNLANPVLLALHAIDENERGAVSRCYMGRYRQVLGERFEVVASEYNGLLIAPQGRVTTGLADLMQRQRLHRYIGRFSPHLLFHLRNR